MNHTPGPWRVSEHDDNGDIVIRDNADAILANCSVDTFRDYGMDIDEHEAINIANARLIAAAPEMLEALRAFNQVWGGMTLGRGSREESIALDKAWNLVRSAIAKAEGRS